MTQRTHTITVDNPGVTTWQDTGRHGFRHVGVPTSGPLHPTRLRDLSTLIPTLQAAWENLTGDIHFTITGAVGNVRAAFTGPAILLTGDTRQPHTTTGTCSELPPGGYVLHRTEPGPVYFAIENWDTPVPVLGSFSTDTHSRLGPESLTAGYRFTAQSCSNHEHTGTFLHPAHKRSRTSSIGFLPHHPHAVNYLTSGEWQIHTYARNGIRLAPHTPHTPLHLPAIASIPVLPGVIQLPPDGNPIVLGPDSGTMGGYPTIGWLPEHHFEQLTQHAPGSRLRFHSLDWDTTPHQEPSLTPTVRVMDVTG